ncbi:MAG: tetratricopeptide repeat protein [Alphaproteobacteria bacterium]|nr:tetratricopeptide repeat protein [Alphaproteobacteria bacterium]
MTIDARSIPDALAEAGRLFASEDFGSAASAYHAVLARSPGHPAAHGQLGVIALRRDDPAAAIEHLTAALRRAPHAPALHHTLATACRRHGQLEVAAHALRRALILQPHNQDALAALADVRLTTGEPNGAAWAFDILARLRRVEPTLWYNLGVALVTAGRLGDAATAYRRNARLLHGRALNLADRDPDPDLPVEPVAPVSRLTCWHRLEHDRRQLTHLRERGLLADDLADEPERYQTLIDGLSVEERTAISFTLDEARFDTIARSYNRVVHQAETGWGDTAALSDVVDWQAKEEKFLAGDPRALTIDGLLTEDALAALRRFCWDSTIWHQIKGAGYLGAYFREGFGDPLVVRIAEELKARMPRVLGPLPVKVIWAYSYEQSMVGINPHADFAAINLNFWITPDEANLDPESGGLLVYRKAAPADWDFRTYNTTSAAFIYDHLGDRRDDVVRVPHRANRAVMFDSRLIHETDRFSFAPGFTNRRINITMLFGEGG